MRRNIATALPRRRSRAQLRSFDALPGPLRRWLASAVLQWSVTSARRIYLDELRRGGDVAAALARLDRAERAMLARERSAVQGAAGQGGAGQAA